jgi:hypothetical protein
MMMHGPLHPHRFGGGAARIGVYSAPPPPTPPLGLHLLS